MATRRLCLLLIALVPGATTDAALSLRQKMQIMLFNDGLQTKLPTDSDPATVSDATLSSFFAGGISADNAVSTFTTLASDESVSIQTKIALVRNAIYIETVRDGSTERWSNLDRAHVLSVQLIQLMQQYLTQGLDGSITTVSPELIPLTQYDIGINGAVCSEPSLAPPSAFVCGDRDSPPTETGAVDAAIKSSELEGGNYPVSAFLYIDILKRSLTAWTVDDLERDYAQTLKNNTSTLMSGNSRRSLLFSLCGSNNRHALEQAL